MACTSPLLLHNIYFNLYTMKSALSSLLVAASAALTASAIELSPANYETETAGKTVFLKFFAPW